MDVNSIMKKLQENAKSIAGFVAGLVLNAIVAVANGQAPWPTSLKQWGTYLGTSIITGVIVWATGNRLTTTQVVKGAAELGISVGGVVAEAAVSSATDTVKTQINAVAANLPQPARDTVTQLAENASQAVNDVLRNFRPGI